MDIGGKLWNDLLEFVQNSTDIASHECNYKPCKLLFQLFDKYILRFIYFALTGLGNVCLAVCKVIFTTSIM